MNEISLHEYCEQIEIIIEQGRYVEAVAHGQHILKQYPKHVATYRLLGKAMLEANQDEYAADMFHRVLGADPEDLVAWVGISELSNRRGDLDAATWHLERAFEVASDNEAGIVEEELRHLYGRRDGVAPERVQLTRAGLARLYLKGDLLSRAISEFHALLAEQPERVDLSVALAEALWRNEQRLEAVEVCQQVLDKHPYTLKANLILGEIWTRSGREEAQAYLRRAAAVDPENRIARELLGAASPLPAREVRLVPLEYRPPTEEERPAWMTDLEAVSAAPPQAEREAPTFDVAAARDAQIELPSWLEEVGGEEAPAPTPPTPPEPLGERPLEEAIPPPTGEVPEWLASIREGLVEEEEEEVAEWPAELEVEPTGAREAPALPGEEEAPEWLARLGLEPIGEEEVAERPLELGVEPTGVEEAPLVPGEKDALEPLAELGVEAAGEEAAPPIPPMELPEDWLAGLRELLAEEVEIPEEPPTPAAEEMPAPAWLEGEGMPSGDEALAWLAQLTAGKEEELQAQAEAEAEARLAEIMGRPQPAEAPPVEAAPEEAMAPPVEEPFGWTPFGEPEAPPAPALPVEEAVPTAEEVPAPAWLEGEGMPSGDEALAWLAQLAAGKEEELQAQAEAEAEARLAEIMGRPQIEEAPPVEAAPEEAVAPPVEEPVAPLVEEPFGWMAFGEPEAPPTPVEAVEEAPPAVEFPMLEEAPPPEEIPTFEAAPPTEEVHWGAVLEPAPEMEGAPAPVVEEIPGVVEMELAGPPEEPIAPPEIPIAEAAAVELPAEPFATERGYLKDHPRDYEVWLALARALWQADERQESLETYTRVIRAGKLLDSVTADLEGYVRQWRDASTQRVLGDAYMKDGRLQKALNIYRRALETL